MNAIEIYEALNHYRRRLLGTAAVTLAATQLGVIGSALAQSGKPKGAVPPIKPGAHISFRSLKQIDAGLLSVGYAEDGPADGPPVVLLQLGTMVTLVTTVLSGVGYVIEYARRASSVPFLGREDAQITRGALGIVPFSRKHSPYA